MSNDEELNPNEDKSQSEKDHSQSKDKEVMIPEEVLENIPAEARGEIKRTLSTMISAGYMGPPQHPLAKKLTEDHVTKIIDNIEKDDERGFQNSREERRMSLTIFFGVLIPVTGLIVFFALLNKTEILVPLISAIVAFGGGYGFGKSKK